MKVTVKICYATEPLRSEVALRIKVVSSVFKLTSVVSIVTRGEVVLNEKIAESKLFVPSS